jgi:hypothetical protein
MYPDKIICREYCRKILKILEGHYFIYPADNPEIIPLSLDIKYIVVKYLLQPVFGFNKKVLLCRIGYG